MSDISPFQKAMDQATKQAKKTKKVEAHRQLSRLFPGDDLAVDGVYVHPTAIPASKILKGELPATVWRRTLSDGIAAFRTSSPKMLWFVSEQVSPIATLSVCARSPNESILTIWSAAETEVNHIWRQKK